MADVHESMKRLSFLIGRWHGTGLGLLPHGPSFKYEEDLVIENIGQPNFAYSATSLIDGVTRHRESGFVKCHEGSQVLFCLADNLGTCSILLGTMETESKSTKIFLTSDSITRSPFNREPRVVEVVRDYKYDGEKLHLVVRLSTTRNSELSDHLQITYERKLN
ncbi:putative fatty acid-binding protein [Echinococcus granulosus]|uniref:THAP domain containing protein 4 n=1 Tax=Echinococcus granulosus TaxID=6210 RepID=U6J428_ECHGR|nr:hypothetical protein EGR_00641 [Echinococcus granulosus]EUB64691.1 hypothetical protein EGR_00641 [Echinococcus granulosus]KAH9285687.1 putative fatty acid-binding protein [Echinococcus granulosus]CDS16433.1 THAP domain containing protein 4 [Echinococcus granulosus]